DFTISLSNPVSTPTTVTYTIADGTAQEAGTGAGSNDYDNPATLTVTIPAGSTTATVSVPVNGDTTVEPDETFDITLNTTNNGTISATDNVGTGTITNDDAVVVSINDITQNEGDAGTTNFDFTISLSNPVSTPTTVTYTIADGTAQEAGTGAGSNDYDNPATLTVTIPAGSTTATVSVPVNGDTTVEPDETFDITLNTTNNGTISATDNVGTGTITNDDAVVVSINDITQNEGDAGTTNFDFTISLSNPVSTPTTVTYTIADGTAQEAGTGAGSNDYDNPATLTVTIPAGSTTATVSVPVNGDTTVEPDETFDITLNTTINGTISATDNVGTGTITNDDATIFSVGDITVAEDAGTANVTVSITNPSSVDTVIDITTSDNTAIAPGDYTSTTTTVTIPAGSTSVNVLIPITDDAIGEPTEDFTVTGTLNTGVASNNTDDGTVTITDNDAPTFNVGDVTVAEDAGTASVTVSILNPSSVDTVIDITTADNTAIAPGDYTSTTTMVTIPAGSTSVNVLIPITDDAMGEPTENFTVTGTLNTGVTSNNTDDGTVTITDNDAPTFNVGDVTVAEDAGTGSVTVSISNPSSVDTVIDITTADNTAIAPGDYTSTTTTVTIPAGSTSVNVLIPITDDAIGEPTENFTVTGTLNTGVTSNNTDDGTVTITDNDAPTFNVGDVTVAEDAGTASVTVSISNPSSVDTVIDIITADNTAIAPGDYTSTTTTVTIPAGGTSVNVLISITDDAIGEPTEDFTVTGTLNTGVTSNNTDDGTVTITDNDFGTVTGTVFNDINGNGVQDAGEPGIPMVDVVITDADSNIITVTTDANGSWSLLVPNGSTTVDVDETTLPVGSVLTTTGSDPETVTVTSGSTVATTDDGYQAQGTVTGTVFNDINGNGVQDAGEPGLADVDVEITDSNGDTQTVTTDANGDWTATVPSGITTIDVDETDPDFPAGGVLTTPGSDPQTVNVAGGATVPTTNDGYQAQGTVTGTVFNDINGNGVQDAGEPGLADVDVEITDSNGDTQTVTTDANGDWTTTVPAGTTTIDVDETDPDFPAGGVLTTPGSDPETVNVAGGATVATTDDGYQAQGTVTGTVFNDINGNGIQDAGEPGFADVDVEITDSNGDTQTVTTDANGDWTATVPAGTTTIDVDETDPDFPAGGVLTTPGSDPETVNVAGGATVPTTNDGYQAQGTVTGTVFNDINGNGVQDAGEPGLADVDVEITDSNGDTQTVTTDANGDWTATVPSGSTTIDVDETDPDFPAGGVLTTPGSDPETVNVAGGATVATTDDGYFIVQSNLALSKTSSGVIDNNMDGITDAGDTIIYSFTVTNNGNVTIENLVINDARIGISNAAVTPSTLAPGATGTIADVTYILTAADITAGNVTNTAVATGDAIDPNGDPAGTVSDNSDDPNNGTNSNPDGDADPDDPTVTVLNANGILSGVVFNDANGNGVQDAAEMGIPNVDVEITASDSSTQTVITDANGNWTVVVPAGLTTSDIDETTLPNGNEVQTAGTDPTTTNIAAGTAVGEPADGFLSPDPNLNLIKTDNPVVDVNGNGIIDAGDTIIYDFVIVNNGNVEVQNITISDPTIGVTNLAVTPSPLQPGTTSATVSFVYAITPTDIDNSQIVNTATATGEAIDPNGMTLGNVSDDSDDPADLTGLDLDGDGDQEDPTVTDLSQPNLAFAKTDTYVDANMNGIVDVGDTITYNFTVTNNGNTIVTNPIIDDSRINVSNLVVTPTTLNPGDSGTASAIYTITAADIIAGDVTNTATVTGEAQDNDGNALPPVTDESDDPDDATNIDNDNDGDFEDPTVFTIPAEGIINGTVFEDTNGNGVQDAGEPGIAGVDVVVTDSNGVPQTVTTDANGAWSAVVPAGDTTSDIDETSLPA
ncbi:Calx-beta domain-containing protein, partial [Nonlabens xiamenensis]|uniref:Calx-beta domain-containing protein n=1 Tax=Nonlabens xiamenensis TaxID=2341043 RepID=UPI000F60470C